MRKREIYQYYVEGEDDKSLLEALKTDLRCIESGKVDKFNAVQSRFSTARIRPLKQGTIIVLVYDTDVEHNVKILKWNIDFLKKQSGIKDVICIPQVRNLEDELIRACEIRSIGELTKSKTKTDYKRDIISCTNLGARLEKCKFKISEFWNQKPTNKFEEFGNDSAKIKI